MIGSSQTLIYPCEMQKFINKAAGMSLLGVNDGLEPLTIKIEHVIIKFEGSSQPVVLVDTPAFPDPGMARVSELDFEMKIRDWARRM